MTLTNQISSISSCTLQITTPPGTQRRYTWASFSRLLSGLNSRLMSLRSHSLFQFNLQRDCLLQFSQHPEHSVLHFTLHRQAPRLRNIIDWKHGCSVVMHMYYTIYSPVRLSFHLCQVVFWFVDSFQSLKYDALLNGFPLL